MIEEKYKRIEFPEGTKIQFNINSEWIDGGEVTSLEQSEYKDEDCGMFLKLQYDSIPICLEVKNTIEIGNTIEIMFHYKLKSFALKLRKVLKYIEVMKNYVN